MAPALQVFFADHDMGFAAGRNATFRASQGRIVVLLIPASSYAATSGRRITAALADPTLGWSALTVWSRATSKSSRGAGGPTWTPIEGYLMAFRRAALLRESGLPTSGSASTA